MTQPARHLFETLGATGAPGDFYKRLIDNLYDAIYFVDRERNITYWNKAAEKLTGYRDDEVIGRCCADNLLSHVDGCGTQLCTTICPLAATIEDGQPREADVFLRHKNGHRVPVSVRVCPITNELGAIVGAVEIFNDNSSKHSAQQKVGELQKLAFFDPMTQLPNRRYLDMKLEAAVREFNEYGVGFGVLVVDIDRFKVINDRHGHAIGDSVLEAVAKSLAGSMRSASDIVGRWGGEEFLAILPQIGKESLPTLAERCRTMVHETLVATEESRLQVTISLGATMALTGDTAESVVARADALMYQSKRDGRDRVTVG